MPQNEDCSFVLHGPQIELERPAMRRAE